MNSKTLKNNGNIRSIKKGKAEKAKKNNQRKQKICKIVMKSIQIRKKVLVTTVTILLS